MSYGDHDHVDKLESVRKHNILASPKQGGCSNADSDKYFAELGISIIDDHQPIQFTQNLKQLIHRWAPYVQGFSSDFVQNVIDKYKLIYKNPYILDPFAGCGTVPVQAKLNGLRSFGVEINPLMHYITTIKLSSWNTDPNELLMQYRKMDFNKTAPYPQFLKTEKQFEPKILEGLCHIKGAIEHLSKKTKDKTIIDLFKVAFCSILIDSSNLKRSPCLGYAKKTLDKNTPYVLFDQKVNQIAEDLAVIQKLYSENIKTKADVTLANSMEYDYANKFDLVITSPPYMNGMDYIINYKIEMAWLDFADDQKTLKQLKNEMVVCDNVSRNLISEYQFEYINRWIEDIKTSIAKRITERGAYRREDMPDIVHKYFDDMYKVFKKVVPAMKKHARFVLVIGDSLIADTYIPTDLFIAKIGTDLGLRIESIHKARNRRSGQIRSYKLRETILTLIKE